MLIVAIAIVLAVLAWLVIKRVQHAEPAAHGGSLGWVIACLGTALALRVGMAAPVLLLLLAIGALGVWLRRRGQGGGPGDDGRDPPVDPGPDPDPRHRATHPDRLEPDAFDRARADWEHTLTKRTRD